jgi:hypothetical protein
MEQINKYKLCCKCFGCNRLENPDFKGVYRCENAIIVKKEEKILKKNKS